MSKVASMLVLALSFTACTSHRGMLSAEDPRSKPRPDEYRIEIANNRASEQFDVRFISATGRALCMQVYQWPNRLGQVHMGMEVRVVDDNRTYAPKARNFGYCVGEKCTIRISPGGTLVGHIAFSEFEDWDYSGDTSGASLHFQPQPQECR